MENFWEGKLKACKTVPAIILHIMTLPCSQPYSCFDMLACILVLDNKLDNSLHVPTDQHMLVHLSEQSMHHSQEDLAIASVCRARVVIPLNRRPGFVILSLHGTLRSSS